MSGSWKVAYADFVTAMMAFFLLMWILAQVPEDKKEALGAYFQSGGQGIGNTGVTIIDDSSSSASPDAQPLSPGAQTNVEMIRYLNQLLRESGLDKQVAVSSVEAGVLLRVQSGVMFAANQIVLDKEGLILLDAATSTIRHFKMNLTVRGHADSLEGSSDGYYSQWEISALRAAVVTRYLVERGGIDPGLHSSVFYGATRPVVPDTSGRPSPENRRVEFFFHRPEFSRPAIH
jgi:chemotaxis protein MotB